MSPPRRQPPEYRQRSYLEAPEDGSRRSPRTLHAGVAAVFPNANSRRLAAWIRDVRADSAAAPEVLLFLVLLCGARLSLARDSVAEILEELWTWLTGPPRDMPRELADLLIESLAPALTRVVESTGWRFGPGGRGLKRSGRPPETRAAWAAALLVDDQMRRSGDSPIRAQKLALPLVAVLLERDVPLASELYRARRRLRRPDLSALTAAAVARYETWLEREGTQCRDPRPAPADADATAAWRKRHGALTRFLGMFGPEQLARLILDEIPQDLWAPFLAAKPAPRTRPRTNSRESPQVAQPRRPADAPRKR